MSKILPLSIAQNPSPVLGAAGGQDRLNLRQDVADKIMSVFLQVLPSNYVSEVQGPNYTLQLRAIAEQMADLQLDAQEVFADAAWDATRPEFLFQILGGLVFPDALSDGIPTIPGDVSYREFMRQLALLLLRGAKTDTIRQGLQLLTTADIEVVERFVSSRDPSANSAWGLLDQFTFDVGVSYQGGTAFPPDPFVLQENARLVLRALKPAHALWSYRYVFHESIQVIKDLEVSWAWQDWKYEDLRKNWHGARKASGTGGRTLQDTSLFSDPAVDFRGVRLGSVLSVLDGPNSIALSARDEGWVGRYPVVEVLAFPSGSDLTLRPYTTSPSGLSGSLVVTGSSVYDVAQDWSLAVAGEVLTILSCPNAGSYGLAYVDGNDGGLLGQVEIGTGSPRASVRYSILRVGRRMAEPAEGQSWEVELDVKGALDPEAVLNEDVSSQFLP